MNLTFLVKKPKSFIRDISKERPPLLQNSYTIIWETAYSRKTRTEPLRLLSMIPMGLPRFYQDSAGKQFGYYIYLKYDSMGRQKETGTAGNGNFDTEILQAFADTGDFPAENCSPKESFPTISVTPADWEISGRQKPCIQMPLQMSWKPSYMISAVISQKNE